MLILARLFFMAIALYMFISLFLENFDDRQYAIPYKIYLFLFIFLIQFLFQILSNLLYSSKISIYESVESAINSALISVIAFDIYNDLVYDKFFRTFNNQQKTLTLVLLIIGFMTSIKLLQLLINSN